MNDQKRIEEFHALFERIQTAMDGADIDSIIPALTIHLADSALNSRKDPGMVLDFIANTFLITYKDAAENLPTEGGVQ